MANLRDQADRFIYAIKRADAGMRLNGAKKWILLDTWVQVVELVEGDYDNQLRLIQAMEGFLGKNPSDGIAVQLFSNLPRFIIRMAVPAHLAEQVMLALDPLDATIDTTGQQDDYGFPCYPEKRIFEMEWKHE